MENPGSGFGSVWRISGSRTRIRIIIHMDPHQSTEPGQIWLPSVPTSVEACLRHLLRGALVFIYTSKFNNRKEYNLGTDVVPWRAVKYGRFYKSKDNHSSKQIRINFLRRKNNQKYL